MYAGARRPGLTCLSLQICGRSILMDFLGPYRIQNFKNALKKGLNFHLFHKRYHVLIQFHVICLAKFPVIRSSFTLLKQLSNVGYYLQ